MNASMIVPALTTAVSIGLGCGTCCSPIISTFLSSYVVSHSGGVKKGALSFLSFFFGKMCSVSLLCIVSAVILSGGYERNWHIFGGSVVFRMES